MKTTRAAVLASILVATCPLLPGASFVKFDGIEGESRDSDHAQWIDLVSVSYVPAVTAPRDAASGMPSGKRTHEPIRFTKRIDKSTPLLAKSMAAQTVFATLELSHADTNFRLRNARITDIKKDGDEETLTVHFEQVELVTAPLPVKLRVPTEPPAPRVQPAEPASRGQPDPGPATAGPQ